MKTNHSNSDWINGLSCLYPTFKEWKQITAIQIESTVLVVYILPLRNENKIKHQIWTRRVVYILPLRNENTFLWPNLP